MVKFFESSLSTILYLCTSCWFNGDMGHFELLTGSDGRNYVSIPIQTGREFIWKTGWKIEKIIS